MIYSDITDCKYGKYFNEKYIRCTFKKGDVLPKAGCGSCNHFCSNKQSKVKRQRFSIWGGVKNVFIS